jgi:hypothetical protein
MGSRPTGPYPSAGMRNSKRNCLATATAEATSRNSMWRRSTRPTSRRSSHG